ncbi:unnamed protein product [Notodromas monacha]|uniref:Major facilitator superfamily (MFS) profile domain-containing protein n=1 Tax=Notodromas monacha TaxID=399045 RepID=A0A7R9GH02_9CRUS|nr:unnamed protein product [Notodromas monacha]CAG0920785.1 unnamed protein product [Notodromas monacha]
MAISEKVENEELPVTVETNGCVDHQPLKDVNDSKIGIISVRWTAVIVTFVGFTASIALQSTTNIALVAMVNFTAVRELGHERQLNSTESFSNEVKEMENESQTLAFNDERCFEDDIFEEEIVPGSENASHPIWKREDGPFVWDETTRPKRVFLGVLVSASLVTSLVPVFANFGKTWIIAIRFCQGVIYGPSFPVLNVVVSRWAIHHERSRMAAVLYSGGMTGMLIVNYVGGVILPKFGYAALFHMMSGINAVWAIVFWLVFHDSPKSHPKISGEELALFPVMGSAQKHQSGTFSAVPYIVRVVFSLVFSVFIDWTIKKQFLSKCVIRKLATGLDCFGSALCLMMVSQVGCDWPLVVLALTIFATLGGASYSGFSAAMMDMTPHFCGTLGGLASMGYTLGGMLTPVAVGLVLQGKQNLSSWAIIYQFGAALHVVSGFCFWILGTTKRQDFDPEIREETTADEDELKNLKAEVE